MKPTKLIYNGGCHKVIVPLQVVKFLEVAANDKVVFEIKKNGNVLIKKAEE